MNHSCSAYTAIIGRVGLGNLQKPFVSTLRLHSETEEPSLPPWAGGGQPGVMELLSEGEAQRAEWKLNPEDWDG